MYKRTTLGCIALVMALAVVFSIGSGVVSAQTYDDIEYLNWITKKSELMRYYHEIAGDAAEDWDFVAIKKCSILRYDLCLDVLDKIDQFDVSPGYLSKYKDECKAAFQDMKWHAYYSKKAADAFLSGDIYGGIDFLELSISYVESITEHLYKAVEYKEKYLEEIENAPRSTSKKIDTPEPTASIIIDSDSDGVPDDYDYAPKDPKVQSKEDAETPGFGAIVSIICVFVVGYFVIRRRE